MKYTYWLASLPFSSTKKRRLCWDFISAVSVYEAEKREFERLCYLSEQDIKVALSLSNEIERMLTVLIVRLKNQDAKS